MNAIWYGTAKDRKAIIKSFKTYVPKIAKEEFGYLVLIGISFLRFSSTMNLMNFTSVLFPQNSYIRLC